MTKFRRILHSKPSGIKTNFILEICDLNGDLIFLTFSSSTALWRIDLSCLGTSCKAAEKLEKEMFRTDSKTQCTITDTKLCNTYIYIKMYDVDSIASCKAVEKWKQEENQTFYFNTLKNLTKKKN